MNITLDCKTENSITQLLNTATTKDKKYRIDLFIKRTDKNYLSEWVKTQDVKLLTLDGTYGGRSGKEFDFLSTDLTAQDDWHIGKKYDAQSAFRIPIVISDYSFGVFVIHIAKEDEIHNGYLIISKKMLREKSKNLKRAKTEYLKNIANKMVEKFIYSFNAIGCGEVYFFQFTRQLNNSCESSIVGDFYGHSLMTDEVMCNIPFNDTEFNKLFEKVTTFE